MLDDSGTADSTFAAARRPAIDGRNLRRRFSSTFLAIAAGALVLPAVSISGAPVHAQPIYVVVALVLAAGCWRLCSDIERPRWAPVVGILVAAVAMWLLAQASYPFAAIILAPMTALAVALVYRMQPIRLIEAIAAVGAAAILVAIRVAFGRDLTMAAGATIVAIAGCDAFIRGHRARSGMRGFAFIACASLVGVLTTAYVGATTPSATWFGDLTSHGPRDRNEVAITFDDGPDPPFTLEIAQILDDAGAKGTFFTVGKALEARPDVSRALYDDGHLLGNHSYHHDAIRWLDPGYHELESTQQAFMRTLGVCPAFFRPPHGTHTPFMAYQVDNAGMTTVTWDLSAGDWATTDGALVAKRVLDKVKPGSIILLHDGIDGNIGADRGVILEALPLILEGLRQRGLTPVRLDELLSKPGYLESC